MNIYNEVKDAAKTTLIDIGGYTAIYMVYHYGKIDMSSCDSLEKGIIRLYNAITKKVNQDFKTHISESEIDGVIRGENTDMPDNIIQAIHSEAGLFVKNLLNQFCKEEIELKTGKTVFTGGGAILLQEYIKECGDMISNPIFISDIKADASGHSSAAKRFQTTSSSRPAICVDAGKSEFEPPITYINLLTSGKLNTYRADVDRLILPIQFRNSQQQPKELLRLGLTALKYILHTDIY